MIQSTDRVYYLYIYAKPKSRQNEVGEWIYEGGRYLLQVHIQAPPEGGKANKAIITLLAKRLGIAKCNIRLMRGYTTRYKLFTISAWSDALAQKLPLLPLTLW